MIVSRTNNWLFGFYSESTERWNAGGWVHQGNNANTNMHIHMGTMTDDPDPRAAFWQDGVLLVTNSTGSGVIADATPNRLAFGGRNGANDKSSKGVIAEFIMYDRVLDDAELLELTRYLTSKYRMSTALPVSPFAFLGVQNQPVSSLTGNSVVFNALAGGELAVFDLTVYYGPVNGGTNEGAWANSAPMGTFTNLITSNINANVSGLTGLTDYFYRFRISNASTAIWSSAVGTFTTLLDLNSIPGLQLSLSADVNVETTPGVPAAHGQTVEVWGDQSANGNDAQQPVSGMRPVFVTNGLNAKPSLLFSNGLNMAVASTPGLNAGTGQTVFVVHSMKSGNTLLQKTAADGTAAGDWRVASSNYSLSGIGPSGLPDVDVLDTRILVGRYNGTWIEVYHDGILVGSNLMAGSVANSQDLILGATPLLSFEGEMSEVIVFDRSVSDFVMEQIMEYLIEKHHDGVVLRHKNFPRNSTVLDPVEIGLEGIPAASSSNVSLTVWYRIGTSGAFIAVPMTHDGNIGYVTDPVLPIGANLVFQFYIVADFDGGSSVWPPGGAVAPITVTRGDADIRQNGPTRRRSPFCFSEVMYNPRSRDDGRRLEFIEIFNSEEVDWDISGFRISGSADYTFPPGSIFKGQSRIVVARSPEDIAAVYGLQNAYGPLDGNLPNGGGTIRFRNRAGAVFLDLDYDDEAPWPVAADGAGHSIYLASPDYGENLAKAWKQSLRIGGSPGALTARTNDPLAGIVINEILPHTDPPEFDFIELFNTSEQKVNVAGCWLTDDPSTNKFRLPPGSSIPARGFLSFSTNNAVLGFELSAMGESIYFVASNETRVIDAIKFDAQENGVASGRYPDGAPRIQELQTPTLDASNADIARRGIVINEIMFNPLSGDTDDEYIEIFNNSGGPVDISSWRFVDGVDFTFPVNTTMNNGDYFVVAKDAVRLMSNYPALNPVNTFGDFSGTLSDRGERVALAKPDNPLLPNQDFVIVDEVSYGDGWGEWADGGGSSLELIDPDSDNRLSDNWTHSDESGKAGWTLIEHTGVLDNGRNAADELQVFLFNEGRCLIDDLEVFRNAEANRVPNPGFESGLASWIIQGTHIDSALRTTEAFSGSNSLELNSSGQGDNSVNRVEADLSSALSAGDTVTIRGRAKWEAGCRNILLRLHGNWLEAVGHMEVPPNLGSPGEVN
ncbi:MAG: lamin tail domain-containing protein, partial [Verrucomicrobiota bacterium]